MGIQINGSTDTVTTTTAGGKVTVTPSSFPSVDNLNATGIVTASSFIGALTGNVTGVINSTGVSTITTLSATSIVGVTTAGITSAYVNTIRNTSGVDITPRIIQVVTSKWDTTGSGSAYITSGTYTDSGASASITPKINGSTIIITVNGRLGSSYGSYIDHYWIIRDNNGNNLPGYTNPLQYIERLQTGSGTSYMFMQAYHENVTGAQTYKLYGAQTGGSGVYIFQPVIFTLMEVMV